MRIPSVLAVSFASLIVIACSGSASSESTGQSAADLFGSCDALVTCVAGSTATAAQLHRDATGSGCVVQGATLLPGGTVDGNASASWSGDADSVRVCQGASCFECQRADGSMMSTGNEPKPKEKTCKGSVSCPSSPPCAGVTGCYLHSQYHYDINGDLSYIEHTCNGSATPCSEMTSSDSCKNQGCRWE